MQDDAIDMDEALIRALLREQAPQWAGLPLRRLASTGTDNALFRLGDTLVLRFPRRGPAAVLLSKELDWLPRLGGLPLDIPVLRFRGRMDSGVNCEFGAFDWIDGDVASPEHIEDPIAAARALARFLTDLQRKSVDGAPLAGLRNNNRGVHLSQLSSVTLPAIDNLAGEIDARRARGIWQSACAVAYQQPPVWLHGDLKADNLIARDGRLRGVIDWGLSAVGDPAADHAAAWAWVDPSARDAFRDACSLDDDDWLRAEGWALYGAVIALDYYRGGRNEALCRQSRLTLSRLGLLL